MLALDRMRSIVSLAALLILSNVAFFACSSTEAVTAPRAAADEDAATPLTEDAASPDAADAAPPPMPPQQLLPNHGGPIVATPEIVTITWQGDELGADFAAFDDWLPTSSYFTTLMAEWGVGKGSHGGVYVVDGAAPATLDEDGVRAVIEAGVAAGKLPAPNGSRIYTLYPPASTKVTNAGVVACEEFLAYHASFIAGSTLAIYAVTPRCEAPAGTSVLDYATLSASHEVIEAASDPDYRKPAWVNTAPSAEAPIPGENADLCTSHPTRAEGHLVTRNYSNVAAKAGKRPCVPAPAGPSFGVYAAASEFVVAPGQSLTVPVYAYADGPLPAFDVLTRSGDPSLRVSLTKTKAAAGDSFELTIRASADFDDSLGANYVELAARSDGYTVRRGIAIRAK